MTLLLFFFWRTPVIFLECLCHTPDRLFPLLMQVSSKQTTSTANAHAPSSFQIVRVEQKTDFRVLRVICQHGFSYHIHFFSGITNRLASTREPVRNGKKTRNVQRTFRSGVGTIIQMAMVAWRDARVYALTWGTRFVAIIVQTESAGLMDSRKP